ncbi:MAG: LuxR C-terminal-related transcriptional regulator [Solirubrobacterales bacterium]
MAELIITKTLIPPLNPYVFTRLRLIDLMETEGLKVVTLIAPAGSGKTTCLASWAHYQVEQGVSVAWYSLDESDNDPARFLFYTLAALDSILDPEISLKPIREFVQSVPNPRIEKVVTLVINALSANKKPICLILDDFHCLTSPDILKIVKFFLKHQPDNVKLAMGSRRRPPFRLSKLRVLGQLTELGPEALRFSLDETRTFLQSFQKPGLTEEDVHRVNQISEGWAAAIQLAALKLSRPDASFEKGGWYPAASTSSGGTFEIFEFLAEEVFEELDPRVQRFLLRTSVADRFCVSLCEALTEDEDPHAILEQLIQASMFIHPLNEEKTWFRYHNLFRQFLTDRLNAESRELVRDLHLKACQWFAVNRFTTESLDHAMKVPDYHLGAVLLSQIAEEALFLSQYSTLTQYMKQFPEPFADQNIYLLAVKAAVSATRAEFEAAQKTLEKLKAVLDIREAQLDPNHDPSKASLKRARGIYSALLSMALVNQNKMEETIAEATIALECLPESDVIIRSVAMIGLGVGRAYTGQPYLGREIISQAAGASYRAGQYYITVRAFIHVGLIQSYQGDLQGAIWTLEEVLERAPEVNAHLLPDVVKVYVCLASMYYDCNNIDYARELMHQALTIANEIGDAVSELYALIGLIMFEQMVDCPEEAIQFAREARITAVSADLNTMLNVVRLLEYSLGVIQTTDVLNDSFLDVKLPRFFQAFGLRLKLKFLMTLGRLDEVIELASTESHNMMLIGFTGTALRFKVFEAVARYQRSKGSKQHEEDFPMAIRLIDDALAFASKYGWIRVFLEPGPDGLELIQAARNHLATPHYADVLLNRLKTGTRFISSNPLSKREREILQYVASGATNNDIAEALVISLSTVKTHLNNVMGKLEAANRTEAVAKARQLGLL